MRKTQKRDNAYYQQQLKHHHPAIHSDFLVGKYSSLREALIEAGIKKPRSRLHELRNAWEKATTAEQNEFLRWLSAQPGIATMSTSIATPSAHGPVAVDRRLEAWAKLRIQVIMDRRRMTQDDVMEELGFKRLNASLGRALARGDKLQPSMIDALEEWLEANKAI